MAEVMEAPAEAFVEGLSAQQLIDWRFKIIEAGKNLHKFTEEFGKKRLHFSDVVKQAVDANVPIKLIHEWGAEAGVQRQTVNLALRAAGIRQRSERSDKGKAKKVDPEPEVTEPGGPSPAPSTPPATPDPEVWGKAILEMFSGDKVAACDFIDQVLNFVVS